jgi:hypothetical protein
MLGGLTLYVSERLFTVTDPTLLRGLRVATA